MPEIMVLANYYGISVIEDAAEAFGSSINEKKCGTFGKMGILSFNGNKIITTSGGGAMISKKKEVVDKATFLATQARDSAPHYQHSEIGYNYRMSNICAGIGRGQMEVLPERINQRRSNYFFYQKELQSLPGITFLSEPKGFYSNRWLTTIFVDSKKTGGITREDIRLALEKENIESRPLWKPMHRQPIFEKYPYYGGDIAESLFDNGLCLPSGSNLTGNNLRSVADIVINTIKSSLANWHS